jgi:hypothetical protein
VSVTILSGSFVSKPGSSIAKRIEEMKIKNNIILSNHGCSINRIKKQRIGFLMQKKKHNFQFVLPGEKHKLLFLPKKRSQIF